MRRAATGLGDNAGNVSLIDRGGHGRRKVVHDNDGVLGQDGEVDDLLAQQLGQNTGADVGDVGRAQTEHLVVHGQEHVLEHGRGVHERCSAQVPPSMAALMRRSCPDPEPEQCVRS